MGASKEWATAVCLGQMTFSDRVGLRAARRSLHVLQTLPPVGCERHGSGRGSGDPPDPRDRRGPRSRDQ
ncbi:hypothetical protein [Streptomyces sp. B3I8]|uniref:hypothetical protein n=1 Tax=Streptomyces sp. B3I8 TaxID=3042303 RepID=UPI00358E7980